MSRRVVGPCAVIPDEQGKNRYLYRGAYLPDGLDGDAVERCIRRGLVAEFEDPAPASDGDPDEDDLDDPDDLGDEDEPDDEDGDLEAEAEAVAEVTEQLIDQADQAVAQKAELPQRPPRMGTRAAWAEFRAAQGHKVDGLKRDELVALPDKP